jgi:hypothetical protein
MSKKLFTSLLLCLIGFGAFFGSVNVRNIEYHSEVPSISIHQTQDYVVEVYGIPSTYAAGG